MTRYLAGVVGLFVIAAGSADPPAPIPLIASPEQAAHARELVRRLGSEVYRDRDRAARELRRMGRFAIAALTEGAADPDPEVRTRCEELLPAAAADDMAVRAAAFLAAPDGPHDFPGWDEFRAVAGNDRSARELFLEVVKTPDNHPVLRACRRPADQLDRVLIARRQRIHRWRLRSPNHWEAPADLPNVAVLFLAESLVPDRTAVPGNGFGHDQYNSASCFYDPQAKDALAGRGPFGPAFRRLAVHWLETREGGAPLDFARNVKIGNEVVARLAARELSWRKEPQARAYALMYLAGFGTTEHLPVVVRQFDDAGAVAVWSRNPPPPGGMQVRDAALLTAVQLTGQNPKAYGFDPAPPDVAGMFAGANPNPILFRPDGLGADRKREVAFQKWADWAAKNPTAP